jgi:hypothetical protein
MSRSITMTFPHDLGVDEAKRRIAERFDMLNREYVDKIGHAEIAWVGDLANLRVAALGQTATAEIEVKAAAIKVEVHLPWLLAAMANKVRGLLQTNAEQALRIGTTKKV